MRKQLQTLAVILILGTWIIPVLAQSHYKSFIVSTCAVEGTMRAMKGKGIKVLCEVETTGDSIPMRRFAFAGGTTRHFEAAADLAVVVPPSRHARPSRSPCCRIRTWPSAAK